MSGFPWLETSSLRGMASGFPGPEMPVLRWASKRLLAMGGGGVGCTGDAPPSMSLRTHMHVAAKSFLCHLPLLLSPFPTMVPCLSCGSGPSPKFPLPWLSTTQPLAYCSPAPGALLLSPLGCLHTANPSPLLGNDLWSLSPSAQPPPEFLRLWCLCQWFR